MSEGVVTVHVSVLDYPGDTVVLTVRSFGRRGEPRLLRGCAGPDAGRGLTSRAC